MYKPSDLCATFSRAGTQTRQHRNHSSIISDSVTLTHSEVLLSNEKATGLACKQTACMTFTFLTCEVETGYLHPRAVGRIESPAQGRGSPSICPSPRLLCQNLACRESRRLVSTLRNIHINEHRFLTSARDILNYSYSKRCFGSHPINCHA